MRYDFFTDPSCITFSFSKLAGFAIVGGSTILKLPQIINILKANSSKGLSAVSYYFETLVFVNTLGNALHQKLAFSVYGENAIILVQNAIVILLIYYYDKSVGIGEKIVYILFMIVYVSWLIMDVNVPEEAWPAISGCSVLLNIASRVPQIISNYQA